MSENGGPALKKLLITMIFLCWFVFSFVLLVYFAQAGNAALLVTVLGQYFTVFGFFAVYSGLSESNEETYDPEVEANKKSGFYMGLFFMFVGTLAAVIGLIVTFSPDDVKFMILKNIPVIFAAFLITLGIVFGVVALIKMRNVKMLCGNKINEKAAVYIFSLIGGVILILIGALIVALMLL